MNQRLVANLSVLALSFVCVGTSSCVKATPPSITVVKANRSLKKITLLFHKNMIKSINIIHLSYMVETPFSATPQTLDKVYSYKYSINNGLTPEQNKKLDAVFSSAVATNPLPYRRDFRWGCKFYDQNGKLIASIYVNRAGGNAVIDGELVGIKGKIFPWLKSTFGPIMN